MPRTTGPAERAAVAFRFAKDGDEGGGFSGYASTYDTLIVDTWMPTMFERGAFTKTLRENAARFRTLWQHDPWEPIGKPEFRDDERGLFVRSTVLPTQRGKDAKILVDAGVIDEMSIGFDVIRSEEERREDVPGGVLRHVREARLWEVSLVTWAANAEAVITEAHAALREGDADALARIAEQLSSERRTVTVEARTIARLAELAMAGRSDEAITIDPELLARAEQSTTTSAVEPPAPDPGPPAPSARRALHEFDLYEAELAQRAE